MNLENITLNCGFPGAALDSKAADRTLFPGLKSAPILLERHGL